MPGMFGEDWGGGALKQNLGGLLTDPKQQAALASSPMFSAGMGLLGSSQDARINPFQAAMKGLTTGKAQAESDEDRERLAKMREALAAMIRQGGGQVPGQPPPSPQEQAMQMSLAPGQPGAGMGGGMAPPVAPNARQAAYAGLPGGQDMQRQQNRMAWEQIIGR